MRRQAMLFGPCSIPLLLSLLAAAPGAVFAQSETGGSDSGQISGRIAATRDKSFPALVTVRDRATGLESRTFSDDQGNFLLTELDPGTYSIKISAPGSSTWKANNIAVETGRVTILNPGFARASRQELAATAPSINSTTPNDTAPKGSRNSDWPALAQMQSLASPQTLTAAASASGIAVTLTPSPTPPGPNPVRGVVEMAIPAIPPEPALPEYALIHVHPPTQTHQQPQLQPAIESGPGSAVPIAADPPPRTSSAAGPAIPIHSEAETRTPTAALPTQPVTTRPAATQAGAIQPLAVQQLPIIRQPVSPASTSNRQSLTDLSEQPQAPRLTSPAPESLPMTAKLDLLPLPPLVLLPQVEIQPNPPGASLAPGESVDHESVENLPESSGRWSSLAAMAAGSAPDAAGSDGLSFRGLSPLLNGITMDGTDNTLAFHARERGSSGNGYATAQAAIGEFQVNTSNFSAESGRAGAGMIRGVTRSGTNSLHGEAAFYGRDAAWGAANAFTKIEQPEPAGTTTTAAGAPVLYVNGQPITYVDVPYKVPDTRLQGSLSAGGPIRRDKLFWFAAFDQHWRDFPGVARANEPQNFFAAPTAQTIQTLAARIGQTPTEALTSYDTVLNEMTGMLGNVPRTAQQWILFPKLDWSINSANHLTVEYNHMRRNTPNGLLTGTSETDGTASFGDSRTAEDAAIAGWTHFLRPTLVNSVRYQYSRAALAQLAQPSTGFEQQLAGNSFGLAPQISVDRSAGFTFGTLTSQNKTQYPNETRQQIVDAVTWARHSHTLKFGYDYNHVTDAVSGINDANGVYSYSSLPNFISDLLAPGHCDQTTTGAGDYPCYSYYRQATGATVWRFDTADYAAFIADDWKALPRLTLSLGVRYDYEDLPNPNKLVANPDLPQTAVSPHDRNNFGPRAALAWDIFGSGKTILRAGYGIVYGRISNATVFSAVTSTGSALAVKSFFYRPLDTGAPPFPHVFSATPLVGVPPNVVYFDRRFQNPQIDQTEVSLEQQLGSRTTLSFIYMGTYGHELPQFIDTNFNLTSVGTINYIIDDPTHAGPIKTASFASKFFFQRLNADYGSMTDILSETNSRYQGGVVRLIHQMSHGFSLQAGYTYAHAIDDNQNVATFADVDDVYDPTDLRLEHGNSNFDVRQRVAGGIVAHEPWKFEGVPGKLFNGFTLATVGAWRTGLPYTMRTTGAVPAPSCSYQQWLEAGGPNGGANCALIDDPGVITGTAVAISGLGASLNGSGGEELVPQVGRNAFRYPATFNLDLRTAKRTTINDRLAIEVMVEAFNALNHQNVTDIDPIGYLIDNYASQTNAARLTFLDGADGKASFGSVTNTNSSSSYRARQMQLGLRFIF